MPRFREHYQNGQLVSQVIEELSPEQARRDAAMAALRGVRLTLRNRAQQLDTTADAAATWTAADQRAAVVLCLRTLALLCLIERRQLLTLDLDTDDGQD